MKGRLSVLHISTSDLGGGAAIAANRLHTALRHSGTLSSMAVRDRQSADSSVLPMPVRVSEPSVLRRFLARVKARKFADERTGVASAVSRGHGYFSNFELNSTDLLAERPKVDVINLHWIANFLDYPSFFGGLSYGQPLVWTLHDMAPMTGGCHYALSCERFTQNCGLCPILGQPKENDLTRKVHQGKTKALANLCEESTRIIAPSEWLATEARRSSLLGGFKVEVIPNGIDVGTFAPRDRNLAREVFGLRDDHAVVLFAADNVSDYRKGMDLLVTAFDGLDVGRPLTLVAMGGGDAKLPEGSVALGRLENPHLMSFLYSAADVFVLPTRADNLPNVLIEAMACGTPCVSFRLGGVPDVVRNGETGLLAQPENVTSLRESIARIVYDDELRSRMSSNCRQVAVAEYSDTLIAARYSSVYDELLEASKALRSGSSTLPSDAQ